MPLAQKQEKALSTTWKSADCQRSAPLDRKIGPGRRTQTKTVSRKWLREQYPRGV